MCVSVGRVTSDVVRGKRDALLVTTENQPKLSGNPDKLREIG